MGRAEMIARAGLFLVGVVFALSSVSTNAKALEGKQLANGIANGESPIRVLLLKDTSRQQAIEEAASLSLDLPVSRSEDATSVDKDESSNRDQVQEQPSYRQVSLALLTLNQRQPRMVRANQPEPPAALPEQTMPIKEPSTSNPNPGNETTRNNTAAHDSSATTSTTTTTATPITPQSDQNSMWSEMYMKRHKPSWMNVSSQFKITGQSIEELKFMMPIEYLLRPAFDSPILLKTRLGVLEGVRSIKFNKHLYTFLGIPYAKPPVDELRFKAPQAIESWDGILQATKWPPFCVQPSMTLASKSSPVHVLSSMMSEDCLYLNIWTPSLKGLYRSSTINGDNNTIARTTTRRRPVMVWLHGGAFQYGGISVDENDGSVLALLGDVVVVTLNYRISAFGFLNANNLLNAPNNVGLLDQQKALQWVHENIKQFGGDPQQVTLFGESAGGHSVGLHMISPKSQPYFKRAILQSGVPISFLRSYDVNSDNKGSSIGEAVSSIMMARRLKCFVDEQSNDVNSTVTTTTTNPTGSMGTETTTTRSDGDEESMGVEGESFADQQEQNNQDLPLISDQVIECMRNKSSLEILKALGTPGSAGFFPTGNDAKGFFPNGPIKESFDADNLKVGPQKDYLIGTNTDEGTFMLHYGLPSLFPAKSAPKVNNVASLKEAIAKEIERMSKLEAPSANKSEVSSASGSSSGGGAQAHLYRPLLKTSTSVMENFMPKTRYTNKSESINSSVEISREAEFGTNIGSLITDIIFLCPARSLAQTLSEAKKNVYFYIYGHRSSQSQYHDWIGVTHHDEVEFVFGRPIRLADVYSGRDVEMSKRMIKTWAHFARTGQTLKQLDQVEWPKYGEEDGNYMNLVATKASVGQRYHDKFCNIYDTVISVHLQDA